LALETVYGEYQWIPYKFTLGHGYWTDISNQKEYFEYVAQKFNIQQPEDW
jgi:hypothetical protein